MSRPMPKGRADDDELSTRQRAKWLSRQREIYDVAARVFHEKGYEQTSMDDIAEAVGLLKGSLYHYIDSKEDLLHGIAKAVNKTVEDGMARNELLEGPAIDRLRAQFHGHTMRAGSDPDFLILVQVYYREFRSLTPEHQDEVMDLRRRYQKYTRDRIRLAQAEASVCADLDVDVIAPAILALLNGVLLAYRIGRPMDWNHIADNYTEFIMQGLRCPPEHSHRAPPVRPGRGAASRSAAAPRR
jgi:AcrR family transcriptional regulator